VLVLHCCFHVYLAHSLHDEFQVSGLLQHASAEVMPATIQDQLLRQTGLRSSLPELERHRSQMSRTCSFRRKHPTCVTLATASPQNGNRSVAQRHLPYAADGLAVRNKLLSYREG
jgi:hypothetical protein